MTDKTRLIWMATNTAFLAIAVLIGYLCLDDRIVALEQQVKALQTQQSAETEERQGDDR